MWFLPDDKISDHKKTWRKLGKRTKKRQNKDKSRRGERKKTDLCFEVMGAETKPGERRGNKKQEGKNYVFF